MANLYGQLQQQAQARRDNVAIVHRRGDGNTTRMTFGELGAMAARFASALGERQENAAAPAIVPIFMGKSPACVAAMLGAIGAGKAFACLNRRLRPPQIQAILAAIGHGTALTDGGGVMVLGAGCSADSPIARMRWWVLDDEALLPPQKKMVEQMRIAGRVEYWDQVAARQAWHGQPAHVPVPLVVSAGDDSGTCARSPCHAGCCLFTSGSTGSPKGVLIAEADLLARAQAEVECFGITSDDILLNVLPFSFDVGLNQLLTAIFAGCSIVLLDSWLPADILRAAAQHKVTGISAVPAIWADMLKAGMGFDRAGAHQSLRYITVSGGDMPGPQLERLPRLADGAGIFKTYGQTEAFRSTALRPEEFLSKRSSVGRPFGGSRVYVVREDGSRCQCGEEGEIVHAGLGAMMGYLDSQDPQHKMRSNPFAQQPGDPLTAIFTGDLGHLDEDGFLYVHGRRDDMLKVAGNRVYPAEIARQLMELNGPAEAEVVGIKGQAGQTSLFAFVVLAAGSTLTAVEIRRQMANRVPPYMLPTEVVILPAMPRTASAKPDRPALTEMARKLLEGGL